MTISHRQLYLVSETAIGSVMNIVMSLTAAWMSGGGKFGPPTMASFIPQTFMVAFMSVLVATLLTRMRRRRGRFGSDQNAGARFGRLAPRNAFLRALLAGLLCLLVMAPVISATLPLFLSGAPGPAKVAAVTASYALLLSLLFTPPALILALNDDRAEPSPQPIGGRG